MTNIQTKTQKSSEATYISKKFLEKINTLQNKIDQLKKRAKQEVEIYRDIANDYYFNNLTSHNQSYGF